MNIDNLRKLVTSKLVISFDIFDTLVQRKGGCSPDIVFEHIVQNGQFAIDSKMLKKARKEAEQIARKESPVPHEVFIEDIYKHINIENVDASQLMNAEIEAELDLCEPKTELVELLNFAIQNGKRVILVSDMYLHSKNIEQVLKHCNIEGYSHLYISCECGCGKRNTLFPYVLQKENITPQDIIHFGDNIKSDWLSPRKYGIKSVFVGSIKQTITAYIKSRL